MGGKFFPDGLTRALTLIGRSVVAQGCQTVPVGLDPLIQHNASPPPESRDVYVQVAGGIDVEDEPLMEQQVFVPSFSICAIDINTLGLLYQYLRRRHNRMDNLYHCACSTSAPGAEDVAQRVLYVRFPALIA